MHVLHIFLYKSVLHTTLKKSDGSRNIACYLASCFFSSSKTQKWMHWHLWCTALPIFCLGSESLSFCGCCDAQSDTVFNRLVLHLLQFCIALWTALQLSAHASRCPSALSHRVGLMSPKSPVPELVLSLHYFTLVTEPYSSLRLSGHGLSLNSVS